jgi:flagellin
LKEINAETLGLTGFNVDGKAEIANAAATKDDLVLSGFTAGATTNGTTTYTKTANNTAATAADVFGQLANSDTITYTGTDTGLSTAAAGNYTYNSATDSFSFNVDNVSAANTASYLTPANPGETKTATVTLGGSSQDVIIDSNGAITAADDGAVLYLDATGNLTKNNSGTDPAATATNLATYLAGAGGAGDTIEIGGTTLTGDGTAVDVTGAQIGKAELQNLVTTAGGTVDGYTVTAGGAVTATYVDPQGALTASATNTTTYYAHENGNVTNDVGAQVYKTEAGALTLKATTAGEKTVDPLKALDDALNQVDALRSDLGAIQNRFDSAITNLKTTKQPPTEVGGLVSNGLKVRIRVG